MKIILSRKGFDSSVGGVASPILPDGSLVSLPIPDPAGSVTLGELRHDGIELAHLASDLTRGKLSSSTRVHLDPDLVPSALPRQAGWRPAFGQCLAAQAHLAWAGVGVGDLFLFFGWFRRVESRSGRYQYSRSEPDLHVLFGWLEVGQVLAGEALRTPPRWLERHPHVDGPDWPKNCIYVARDQGTLAERAAGAFSGYSRELQLTAPEAESRSHWSLPRWFLPKADQTPLSYHSDPGRWASVGKRVMLSTVGRGQEFILDASQYPESPPWAAALLAMRG